MSNSAKAEAVLALHRFGMGPRPGSIAAVGTDPRGALIAELDRPLTLSRRDLPASAKAYRTVADANARRTARAKQAQQQAKKQQRLQPRRTTKISFKRRSRGGGRAPPGEGRCRNGSQASGRCHSRSGTPDLFGGTAKVRTEAALAADIGFAERLVWFWSNHFCISAIKDPRVCGAYEREAVRPNVLGRFGRSCCWRLNIQPCCSISTISVRWVRARRRHQSQPGPQRKPVARGAGAAHAGRTGRLQPG